jgi:hypothetical protein
MPIATKNAIEKKIFSWERIYAHEATKKCRKFRSTYPNSAMD